MLSSSPLLAAFMLAQAADTLSIRFIGNAAFALSDGETTLVTDFPYRSGAFGYMAYDLAASGPTGPVVSVITHRHDDHFAPALFAQRGWRLIAPPEVQGRVPADRRLTIGGPVVVGAFTIIPHDTPHSDVQHWSYEILWWNRRLYFTGDTEDPAHLAGIGNLDMVFVTPWLLCSVLDDGNRIAADRVVLHHQFAGNRDRICGSPVILEQGTTITLTGESR